ncbi:uncharacterized protein LOC108908248 [Anoplophora glabripennis]|uniref:uncharacterized protein LOC108908248 n=1 Tax=Anoplophora glabripennis TaxID=217634 RepID=UPI000873EE1E|nr:uncharacterized protein LOC108908248 [Anoplophora glabripennis]
MYVEADKLVDTFNEVFGWPLLLLLCHSVVILVYFLGFFTDRDLKLSTDADFLDLVASMIVVYTVITLFGPILITFACDSVVREANKLLKMCYNMQVHLPLLAREKEELDRLTNLIHNNGPKFTAANFFEIKRSTLLSIIATTTTYMIVILQFNYL